MKSKYNALIMLLIAFNLLLVTINLLPYADTPEPSPYFHTDITPIIYWIGFISTFILILGLLYLKEFKNISYLYAFILIIILAVYIYDIPKLFYKNSLYGDTYIFISELFHIVTYSRIGGGHSDETPGLSLLSSQFSIVTGIEYVAIAEILQYIIPLFMMLFIYLISNIFTSKRTSLITCLAFISINWMGFHFNRQSFSFMFQTFIYYLIFKFLTFEKKRKYVWYILISLSYFTLVISHPLSSLLLVLMNILLIMMIYTHAHFKDMLGFLENTKVLDIQEDNIIKKTLLLLVTFLILWFSWNIFTFKNYDTLVRTIIWTLQAIGSRPSPIEPARNFVSGYTEPYAPIVFIRISAVIYETVIGLIISVIAFLKMKDIRKSILLLSWFFSSLVIAPAGLYTGHFFDRTFLHALPVFSILFAWFINSEIHVGSIQTIMNSSKRVLTAIMVVFFLSLPLSMYSITPFVFPPSTYIKEIDHVTKYGNGKIAIPYSDSVIGYIASVNNATDLDIIRMNYTSQTDIDMIVITYRFYTKRAFERSPQFFLETIMDIEKGYTGNVTFSKVYDSDSWHRIYVK